MSERTLEELLAMVARSLGASSVRVIGADEEVRPGPATLRCDLAGGRCLIAELPAPPPDAAALQRRLEMLADTFSDLFPRDKKRRPARAAAPRTLREELAALVQRAGASDAVVIDAHSPVVWGWAEEPPGAVVAAAAAAVEQRARTAALHSVGADDATAAEFGITSAQGVRVDPGAMGVVPRAICARHRVLPIAREGDKLVLAMADPRNADAIHDVVLATGLEVEPVFAGESMAAFFRHLDEGSESPTYEEVMGSISAEARATRGPRAERAKLAWARATRARRAVAEVRAMPEMATLHKGGHLRAMVSEPDFGYVARSFAAIYVLVVIFERPFEELLVKRAVAHVLPTIERLVAALPPLDPTPQAGAVAMRRRKRR